MKKLSIYLSALCAIIAVSCNTSTSTTYNSVLVVCQGTALTNGSITQYNTQTKVTEQNYYEKANSGLTLGVNPMSLYVYGRLAWVPVESSVVTFDPITGAFTSRIPNMVKPSHINFFGNAAYISDISKPEIYAYNLNSKKFFDTIELTSPASSLVFVDQHLYTNLWSFGRSIVKINPLNGQIVDKLSVGIQPNTLLVDQSSNLWTLTDGGYPGNPLGDVAPEIVKISTANTMSVIRSFPLVDGPNYQMSMSTWGTKVYYTAGNRVFCMAVDATTLPTTPIIEVAGANFSIITEDPFTGEIYVGDAGDWVGNGKVYRYSADYTLLDSFTTAPNPMAFCFIQ